MAYRPPRPDRAMFARAVEDADALLHHRSFRVLDELDRPRAILLIDQALAREDRIFAYLDSVVEDMMAADRRRGIKRRLRIVRG